MTHFGGQPRGFRVFGGRGNWRETGDSIKQHGFNRNPNAESWINGMITAISEKNGESFLYFFKEMERCLPEKEIRNMPENVMHAICHNRFKESLLPKKAESPFKKLLYEMLRLRQMLSRHPTKWSDVVKHCILLLDMYIDIYVDPKMNECSWLVPGLAVLCNYMNKAAFAADSSHEETGGIMDDTDNVDDEETQNKYTKEVLNAIRPKLGKVRGDQERQGAYIVLLGQSIKRCLQLGNMQMAAGFLKLCDSRQLQSSRVPRGPMVNFRYYLGKLYMQQEQFDQSETELVWAFSQCPEKHFSMRKNILECLVPVRLRLGKVPPENLLQKYKMRHFLEIISAIRSGNVLKFDRTMEEFERTFIKHGTIFCVERIKFVVYRRIVQRTRTWWLKSGLAVKTNMVPLSVFAAAIKWQIDDIFDEDEMACILANLIKIGFLKGYISWEHMVIVFSNQAPFPPLKTIAAS